MPPSETATRRDGRRAARAAAPPQPPLPRPRRPGDLRRGVRPALRRAEAARGGASRARHRRLADTPRGRAAVGQVPEGRAPRADGLAREGDDRRGPAQVGRRRPQAARLGRAGRLRDRAEDRRLGDLARLRERRARPRRHARRRPARGGRDRQPAHDPVDPAHAPGRGAAADGGARRGLLPALRLPPLQRGADRGREGARAEPAQRGRGLAPPARLADHRGAAALGLDLRHRATARASRPTTHFETLEWLRERGFRTNPYAERLESIEEVAKALRRVGAAARRARLRDRRDRDQGRLVRPAARGSARCTSGRAGRAPTSGRR